MLFKICYKSGSETVAFAARELKRYITKIDEAAEVALMRIDADTCIYENAILLGRFNGQEKLLPKCADAENDDGVYIDVNGTSGVITGTNDRAVLIAAYRFLYELGCRFLRPGKNGEMIPKRSLGGDVVKVCETASYRHRGMCIEGAVSFDHVLNMIDWLPKVGMNGYFNQFIVPFAFFDRWYTHKGNESLGQNPLSESEIADMVREHIREIKKRGMDYHAAGHGWTCEPFGIEGGSWEKKDYFVPPESLDLLAMVNGKRGLSDGLPLNTNLCYSNPDVRERMLSAIAGYCEENKDVSHLHFWLADGMNNHCECGECKRKRPSDFYVDYLNELDDRLTSLGVDTKIVFLIYVDLLWEPEVSRIKNPDRFVLMFAPITRTYSSTLYEADTVEAAALAGYERNRLVMPRSVAENAARLRKWQEQFCGDSFIFDYHFMWDHMRDPGGMQICRVLFEDMKNLDKFGLNGMVSCQLQRAFFPSGLGVSLMARALWDKTADFDKETDAYFKDAFGGRYAVVRRYLEKLTELFDPAYLRHEKDQTGEAAVVRFAEIPELAAAFEKTIADALSEAGLPSAVRESWEILGLHRELVVLLAKALLLKARGNREALPDAWENIAAWARENELRLADVFEVYYYLLTMKNVVLDDGIVLF